MRYFIHLIEKERTGTPIDFARKLGVSERTIYNSIDLVKMSIFAAFKHKKNKTSFP